MGMRRAREGVVYRRHPLVQEAVGVAVDRAGKKDHLGNYAVYLAGHAEELVRICGPCGFVERIDEVDIDPAYPVGSGHREFTSFSLTRE